MAAPEVSHGRGGAGNINPDDTQYVDGEVVRVGVEGSHNDGAFSTGRGGTIRRPFFSSLPPFYISSCPPRTPCIGGRGGLSPDRFAPCRCSPMCRDMGEFLIGAQEA